MTGCYTNGNCFNLTILVGCELSRQVPNNQVLASARRRRRSAANEQSATGFFRRRLRFEVLEDRHLLTAVMVTTLADTVNFGDGLLSLREAIFATNLVPGADTIDFAPALTAGGPATILLTQSELKIIDSLTIAGPGSNLLTIDASGNDPTPDQNYGDGSRVFHVDDGISGATINATISGLALTGGDVADRGGAVLSCENLTLIASNVYDNSANNVDALASTFGGGIDQDTGSLTVSNCVIDNNSADFGGGIYLNDGHFTAAETLIVRNGALSGAGFYNNNGEAEISRSEISDNSAPAALSLGGGIYTSGNLSLADTTISGNSADFGGGVFSRTASGGLESTTISNSTISGNTAIERGGGIRNAYGLTVIEHSTITGNVAPAGEGSGVASRGYDTTQTIVRSTIIAGNANGDVDFVTGGVNTFQSGGYNLIGVGTAASAFHEALDQTGVADPRLGPLTDNGGFELPDGTRILTHAPLPGSPAIDAGDASVITGQNDLPLFDERGTPFSRTFGGRIDIGALESQPNPLAGDYNFNGVVDAADYTIWRGTLGATNDLRADGDGNGVIDSGDFDFWRAHFGGVLAGSGAGSPRLNNTGRTGPLSAVRAQSNLLALSIQSTGIISPRQNNADLLTLRLAPMSSRDRNQFPCLASYPEIQTPRLDSTAGSPALDQSPGELAKSSLAAVDEVFAALCEFEPRLG
jgi:hypothetical protein